jgi:hypothetical protein
VTEAPEAGCQVFWNAGMNWGQVLPLLPFLNGPWLAGVDNGAGGRDN